jgi:hypothetical protein
MAIKHSWFIPVDACEKICAGGFLSTFRFQSNFVYAVREMNLRNRFVGSEIFFF